MEREINELNIQLRSNKLTSGYGGAIEDQRVQELRDEIAKKQMQISQAQRDYKELLENPPKKQRYSSPFSPGKDQENQNTNNFGMRSGSAGVAPSNEQLLKLESEIGDIKKLLQNQQQPS